MTATNTASEPLFSWVGYFQAMLIMSVLLLVFWLVLYLVKRSGRFSFVSQNLAKKDVYVEQQVALAPRKALYVVRFLNKKLLLGVSEQHITVLSESEITSSNNEPSDFKRYIESASQDDVAQKNVSDDSVSQDDFSQANISQVNAGQYDARQDDSGQNASQNNGEQANAKNANAKQNNAKT